MHFIYLCLVYLNLIQFPPGTENRKILYGALHFKVASIVQGNYENCEFVYSKLVLPIQITTKLS